MTRYLGPKTDPANPATQADRLDLATTNPTTITPGAAAAQGSGTTAARADHTHAITTAAPTTNLSATTTNEEGNATSFARSNHTHAISTGTPGTMNGVLSTEGSSAALARANHTHRISPPRCRISLTSTQSIPNNTGTIAALGTGDFNEGSMLQNASSPSRWQIKIPAGGEYLIAGHAEFAANNTNRRELGYALNGTSSFEQSLHATQNTVARLSFTVMLYLDTNDTLDLVVFHQVGSALNLNVAHLEAVRLG